ncbi:hypothetical protein [Streptomyces sp. NPDC088725]|uniref:hypothetical protein n=1 Tax=Streptomyces sp. NPDC088725 TaxID=3365873 RepID=UPI0038253797
MDLPDGEPRNRPRPGKAAPFMFGLPWLMSFFHQDAYHDGPTPTAVVKYHFVEDLAPETVLLVRRDAQRLAAGLDAGRIDAIWRTCTDSGPNFYRRDGAADSTGWMRHIVGLCDVWLSRAPSGAALAEADLHEGWELADRVRAVLGETRGDLPPEVGDALEEAVDTCTPDLAFRLLVRALPNAPHSQPYFTITGEQYASLTELAAAFDYGEYALEDLDAVFDG